MIAADHSQAILTKRELETPRTAAEMLAWVDAMHARFNTKQLKVEARQGKHFADQLIHEARPMALFANRHFSASSEVIITHVIGDQNHDCGFHACRPGIPADAGPAFHVMPGRV